MKKVILFLFVSLLILACSSDDSSNNENQNPQEAFISATINGEELFANSSNALTPIRGQYFEYTVFFVLQVSASLEDGRSIVVNISGGDFDNVVDGFEIDAGDGDDSYLVKGFFFESNSELGDEGGGESELEAYVRITSIDRDNQIVSGVFSFVAIDDDDNAITYNVTEGEFGNIPYDVLE